LNDIIKHREETRSLPNQQALRTSQATGIYHHTQKPQCCLSKKFPLILLVHAWLVIYFANEARGVFYARTYIDLATHFLEAIHIRNKTASHVEKQFKNMWLTRYPQPLCAAFMIKAPSLLVGADFQ
jgi:hypothetical protein